MFFAERLLLRGVYLIGAVMVWGGLLPWIPSAVAEDGFPSVVRWNPGSSGAKAEVQGMKVDPGGHLVVAGDLVETNGLRYIHVTRFTPSGDLQWTVKESVGSSSEPGVRAMGVGLDGGVVVTGIAGTMKWDAAGVLAWTAGGLTGLDMAMDPVDNVVVTGFSETELSLAMLSPQGSNQWIILEKPFPENPQFKGVSRKVAVNAQGEIFVGSGNVCIIAREGEYFENWITKYSPEGQIHWRYVLSECGHTYYYVYNALHALADGGVLVMHIRKGWEPDPNDATRFNANGQLLFGPKFAWAMVSVFSPNEVLFGIHDNVVHYGLPFRNIRTSRMDGDGTIKWSTMYLDGDLGDAIRHGHAICLAPGKDWLAVTGIAPRPESGGDIVTLGYDSETGRELWVRRWNGSANGEDEGRAVVADEAGNVFVAGTSDNAEGGRDVVLLKYAAVTPVAVLGDDVAVEFPAPVGASVGIQGSTNLVDWLDLGTTQADSEGVARYRDTNVLKTLPQRYYRSKRE
jgi:hypothetical protein